MTRAFVHIALLLAAGAVTIFTVTPADGAQPTGHPAGAAISAALERALVVPGGRLDSAVEETAVARGCVVREVTVPRPVDGSARVAVKIVGTRAGGARCEAWSWVRVRVVADVSVTTRAVRAGDALAAAVAVETREIAPGRQPADLVPGAVATRSLPAGAIVEADAAAAATTRPGDTVKILVVAGALVVEQSGRAVPCARGRSCAVLPSGKHVEGDFVDGRLVVTLQ